MSTQEKKCKTIGTSMITTIETLNPSFCLPSFSSRHQRKKPALVQTSPTLIWPPPPRRNVIKQPHSPAANARKLPGHARKLPTCVPLLLASRTLVLLYRYAIATGVISRWFNCALVDSCCWKLQPSLLWSTSMVILQWFTNFLNQFWLTKFL